MSSKKRVSLPPASVADLKRQRSACETNGELQCLICLELVVDATQVACCGALHCRACISQCITCPNCRKPVSAANIIPDFRSERLSAAAARPCLYADSGCNFEGNRAAAAAHEDVCCFVPFDVLRQQVKKVTRDKDREIGLHMSRCLYLSAEKIEMQQALMKCALGPEPAENALRLLYELPPNYAVARVSRTESYGKSCSPLSWISRSVSFHIQENHHNVAVWFVKDADADRLNPNGYPEGRCLLVKLLHPYDVTRARPISIHLSQLNGLQQTGLPNFMTSSELDDYCVNGSYFLA